MIYQLFYHGNIYEHLLVLHQPSIRNSKSLSPGAEILDKGRPGKEQ